MTRPIAGRRTHIGIPQNGPYILGGCLNLRLIFDAVVLSGVVLFLLFNLFGLVKLELHGRVSGQHGDGSTADNSPESQRYILDRGIVGDTVKPSELDELIRHSWELDQQRDDGESARAADLHAAAIAHAAAQKVEVEESAIHELAEPPPLSPTLPSPPPAPHPGWNQTDWPLWWFAPFFDHSSFGKEAAMTIFSMVR